MAKDTHPLRLWRQTHDKRLRELAQTLGVAPSHLSQIETGSRAPSLALAAKLSRETGIPTEDFVKERAS